MLIALELFLLPEGTVEPPKFIAISSSSLILSWSPPTTHQSIPIIGYNYTCIGINVSYTMNGSVFNTSLSVTLLGLIPFREYTCNVSTITRYGIGISTNVHAVTDQAGMQYNSFCNYYHILYSS